MTKRDLSDSQLDALFDAQNKVQEPPSAAFMARLAQDAAQAAAAMGAPDAKPGASPSIWARLRAAWGVMGLSGGVVAAAAAGVWIGVSAPQGVPDPALLWSAQDAELSTEFSTLLETGWFAMDVNDDTLWEDGLDG